MKDFTLKMQLQMGKQIVVRKGNAWAIWWMCHQVPFQLVQRPGGDRGRVRFHVVLEEEDRLPPELILSFLLDSGSNFDQPRTVRITVDRLTTLQVLLVDDTVTIPPNTQQNLLFVSARLATVLAGCPASDHSPFLLVLS